MARNSAVGLDIGTSSVRAVEMSLGRHGAKLLRFGHADLPIGAVRDGEVIDSEAVAHAIKEVWSAAKFKSRKVTVGVANQRVIVRQVDLPWLPPDEMRASLAYGVQDFIPMPVTDATLDYQPLEEFTADNGQRMLRALLVAADSAMIERVLDAVRGAGLTPVGIDLTPFAVLRALGRVDDEDAQPATTEALVEIGASVTNIVVHSGGRPRFVRILLLGGDDITTALSDRLGLPAEDAEQLKARSAMSPVAGEEDSDAEPGQRVVELAGSAFVDEIRSSLDYYLAQPGSTPLSRLVVSGGGSQLGHLVRRLGQATRVPVVLGDPVSSAVPGKGPWSAEELQAFRPRAVVAMGLALGQAS